MGRSPTRIVLSYAIGYSDREAYGSLLVSRSQRAAFEAFEYLEPIHPYEIITLYNDSQRTRPVARMYSAEHLRRMPERHSELEAELTREQATFELQNGNLVRVRYSFQQYLDELTAAPSEPHSR